MVHRIEVNNEESDEMQEDGRSRCLAIVIKTLFILI